MGKKYLFLLLLISLGIMGCSTTPNLNDISLEKIIEKNKGIQELYYEADFTDKGMIIESLGINNEWQRKQKVWAKDDKVRIENAVSEDNKLLYVSGLIYSEEGIVDEYYKKYNNPQNGVIGPPLRVGKEEYEGIRSKTILGIIDNIETEKLQGIDIEKVNGEKCVVLKCDSENIDTLCISLKSNVPLKIQYNDNTSVIYKNVKVGSGTVSDKDLLRPEL